MLGIDAGSVLAAAVSTRDTAGRSDKNIRHPNTPQSASVTTARIKRGEMFRFIPAEIYNMKPRSGWAKRFRFGKTVAMSVGITPNHFASVAEYSSTEVVGIHRPSSVSSGPSTTSAGM